MLQQNFQKTENVPQGEKHFFISTSYYCSLINRAFCVDTISVAPTTSGLTNLSMDTDKEENLPVNQEDENKTDPASIHEEADDEVQDEENEDPALVEKKKKKKETELFSPPSLIKLNKKEATIRNEIREFSICCSCLLCVSCPTHHSFSSVEAAYNRWSEHTIVKLFGNLSINILKTCLYLSQNGKLTF